MLSGFSRLGVALTIPSPPSAGGAKAHIPHRSSVSESNRLSPRDSLEKIEACPTGDQNRKLRAGDHPLEAESPLQAYHVAVKAPTETVWPNKNWFWLLTTASRHIVRFAGTEAA